MIVTVVPIIVGALGTVPSTRKIGLKELEITGRIETLVTTSMLRSAAILRRVLET